MDIYHLWSFGYHNGTNAGVSVALGNAMADCRNDEAEENRADIDVGNKSIPGKSDQKEGKL